jgi:dGTPase
MPMDWTALLSKSRFENPSRSDEMQRSVFQRDYDRIVFSSAFRRLQDKTQVHPFATSDYVRKRLTHSLEVSSVGRSLGFWLGQRITAAASDKALKDASCPYDVAQIVSNACLAHDIGNPPFGHAGEKAIADWFRANLSWKILEKFDEHDRADFERFEGNAQGFRLITRLQNSIDSGGLRLTYATLGAFTKYPSTAYHSISGDNYIGAKKHGFFKEDTVGFAEAAKSLGLMQRAEGSWSRHPLVYLVEAADDICYNVVDIEDAFKLGRISFNQAEEFLAGMLNKDRNYTRTVDENSNIGWLRAQVIGSLIDAVQTAYEENESEIMSGNFSNSLIDVCHLSPHIVESKKIVKNRVFNWDRTIMSEIAGVQMIDFVLNMCMCAIDKPDKKLHQLILKIIPNFKPDDSDLKKVHAVTDFVSCMTDNYLRSMFLKFSGNSTP